MFAKRRRYTAAGTRLGAERTAGQASSAALAPGQTRKGRDSSRARMNEE